MSRSVKNSFDTFVEFWRFLTWPLSAGPFCGLSPWALGFEKKKPKFRGWQIRPSNLGGRVSEIPCFTVVLEGRPWNLGGEISPPKVRGYGLWKKDCPCPSFPCFFLEKGRENHQKKQGFFIPTEPLKFLEKKGKTLKKNKEILARRKKQGIPKKKSKEWKDRGATLCN